jgi:CBS domain-containing protein
LARDIMSHPVVRVRPDASVGEAVRLMAEHNLGAVVVVDEQDTPCGILTESDLLVRVAHPHYPPVLSILGAVIPLPGGESLDETLRKITAVLVSELMSSPVHTTSVDTPVANVADLMVEEKVRHVPVLEDGRLVGMVSRGDLVRRYLVTRE